MRVKFSCSVILRIHKQQEYRWRSVDCALYRVRDQACADTVTLEPQIDGESSNQSGRHISVSRQSLGNFNGQVNQGKTRSGKGIVPSNDIARGQRQEAIADTPPHILPGLLFDVAIECDNAAIKMRAILAGKPLNTKIFNHGIGRTAFDALQMPVAVPGSARAG